MTHVTIAPHVLVRNIHQSAWRDCMRKVGRVVVRYSSMHETYEKALPNRPLRCPMELHRASSAPS
jgi:hypothetical protein